MTHVCCVVRWSVVSTVGFGWSASWGEVCDTAVGLGWFAEVLGVW